MKTLSFFSTKQLLRQIATLALFSGALFLSSCNDDEVGITTATKNLFIVNEGNFGSGNGSLAFADNNGQLSSKAFQTANSRPLGDVVQSMALMNSSTAYIVVNNDNKVEVMNTANFSSIATITDLDFPRYALKVSDTKAYISNWGTFDGVVPAYLAVLDLNTHTVTDTITMGSFYGSDRLYLHNGKVYVMNNFINTISVVDVATDEVDFTLAVGDAPSTAINDGNNLWVLCSGGYGADFNDPSDDTPAQVAQISFASQTVANLTNIGAIGDHPSRMVSDGSSVFLAHASGLWKMPLGNFTLPNQPLVSNVNIYGLGVASNGFIYTGDANSFTSAGTVNVYNDEGELQETFSSEGVGPNGFVWLE